MRRLAASFVVLASVTVIALASVPTQAVSAAPTPVLHPVIPEARVVNAPIGEKGALMTPATHCSNYRVEPVSRSVMTNLDTNWRRTYRWKGAYPGYGFPRAAVGDYRIRTVARCRGVRRFRTEFVTIEQKTRRTTMSRVEFSRVKRGMTRSQVARVVGFNGEFAGKYGGETSRLYEGMDFWSWSFVDFRRGRVVEKYFDVDHD